MKLKHIYNILKENIINLEIGRERRDNNSQIFEISDVEATLKSIKNIKKLDILESLDDFKEKYSNFYSWSEDIYSDSGGTTSGIVNDLNKINQEVDAIINILEKFIPEETGYVISVKLPEYGSLSDLPRFYKDLDTMLTPLINYFGDDTLTIHSFENGSKWNDFLVQNEVTMKIILAFLSTGIALFVGNSQIKKDRLEMEKIQLEIQQIKGAENENLDILDKMYEARQEKEYDRHIAKFIQILEEEKIEINTKGRSEGEIEKIIKHSFKSYQILLSDGTEFYGQLGDTNEDESINKLVESLDSSQKSLINLKEFQLLTEGKVKSLMESTYEEIVTTTDPNDEN